MLSKIFTKTKYHAITWTIFQGSTFYVPVLRIVVDLEIGKSIGVIFKMKLKLFLSPLACYSEEVFLARNKSHKR